MGEQAVRPLSAIILAGGYSSRMHRNKAELELNGKTLLELQVEKMRRLGITDILLSGYEIQMENVRCIPDVIAHCGPLSGIHACLCAMKNPSAYVISVDAPLIPETFLEELYTKHTRGVTVAQSAYGIEPLIGIYDKELKDVAEKLLDEGRYAVRGLYDAFGVTTVPYKGDPLLLSNCNTPEEYDAFVTYCKTNENVPV